MNVFFGAAAGLLAGITLILCLIFHATGHAQLAEVTLKLGGVPMVICFALWAITGMFGGGSGGGRPRGGGPTGYDYRRHYGVGHHHGH